MALVIPVSGGIRWVRPEAGIEFELKEMQEQIGGYITCIQVGGFWMVMDEDGLAKDLKVNQFASDIAHQTIVGPVMICSMEEIGE